MCTYTHFTTKSIVHQKCTICFIENDFPSNMWFYKANLLSCFSKSVCLIICNWIMSENQSFFDQICKFFDLQVNKELFLINFSCKFLSRQSWSESQKLHWIWTPSPVCRIYDSKIGTFCLLNLYLNFSATSQPQIIFEVRDIFHTDKNIINVFWTDLVCLMLMHLLLRHLNNSWSYKTKTANNCMQTGITVKSVLWWILPVHSICVVVVKFGNPILQPVAALALFYAEVEQVNVGI